MGKNTPGVIGYRTTKKLCRLSRVFLIRVEKIIF